MLRSCLSAYHKKLPTALAMAGYFFSKVSMVLKNMSCTEMRSRLPADWMVMVC